jgi:hypothetical protein
MTPEELKKIANEVELTMLESQAKGDITSYSIEMIPDDNKLDIYFQVPVVVKDMTLTIKVNRDGIQSTELLEVRTDGTSNP